MKQPTLTLRTTATWLFILIAPISHATDRLRLATTTSTENTGLISILNAPFKKRHDIAIDVIAVGTGKALRLAQNGDVDLIITHAPAAEIKFIQQGYGINRQPLMYNDFIIIGSPQDPSQIAQTKSLKQALHKLSTSGNPFISRGDQSGTHQKEIALWESAGIQPQGKWYLSTGQNMGAVLHIANDKLAYTLSDRGTYLSQRHQINLKIVFSGGTELHNPYHVIIVNPAKHPHIKFTLAKKYTTYITSTEGQKIIQNFTKYGQKLFIPNALPPHAQP